MTHIMITMLHEGIKLQHPDWNDDEILIEMRKKLDFDSKMHKRGELRESGRIN